MIRWAASLIILAAGMSAFMAVTFAYTWTAMWIVHWMGWHELALLPVLGLPLLTVPAYFLRDELF